MPDATAGRPGAVGSTDLLKVAGILLVFVDHHGYFFDPENSWLRLFGRVAAPIFFFLIGFARSRRVPWTWLALGAALTAINAAEAESLAGTMVNILINFALLRAVILPAVEGQVMPWPGALLLVVAGCILLIPLTDKPLEYGTAGWLWAFFGLSQRLVLDQPGPKAAWTRNGLAIAAGTAYTIAEAHDFGFDRVQIAILALLIAGLCLALARFRRAPLEPQPPAAAAPLFRFVGRHSLEIYAISLFVSHALDYALR